jgi:hypothetical protein
VARNAPPLTKNGSAMANAKIQYHGDINPEYGGYFYSLKDAVDGYASVVRIDPCSDAGLAENEFWIECLTVNFPESDEENSEVLAVIGLTLAEVEKGTDAYYATIINACLAYGRYDKDSSESVRIGARDAYAENHLKESDITKRLQHNAKIGNYARKVAREYF